jgi:hypothetical protein
VFGPIRGAARPDASRRVLHRVHVASLQAIVAPPAPAATAGPGAGAPAQASPLLAASNLSRSDIAALARAQLREIRDQARQATGTAPGGVLRAHWQDIADRIDRILDPGR